ncbi:MAG: DUF3089 domain-containing protein [Pseudomonadota bacterium]
MKKPLVIAASLLTLVLVAAVLAFITLDRWVFAALDPGVFDPDKTPAAPDYGKEAAWAALPTMVDDADTALPELPAVDPAAAAADVFFVHPTTSLGSSWNAPPNDPVVVQATARGATLIQASVFNACCAVYAPRYRQAHGTTFVEPSPDGARAQDIAYSDVAAAFEFFLEHHSRGRPFILASHSQGTVLSARLLRERIWGQEAGSRLVAAYLIGGPITRLVLGPEIPLCASAEQTGCVIAYNARGPRYVGNDLDFANPGGKAVGRPTHGWLCTNPLSWSTDDVRAPASAHAGALFLDADTPRVLPSFADARCQDGRLLVEKIGDIPRRDVMSWLLLRIIGPQNYHPIEYQLFYVNLRRNAQVRVRAWLEHRAEIVAPASMPG